MGSDENLDLSSVAKELVRKLKESSARICAVESCTGGMISDSITDIPGASDVFWGGFVTYQESAKRSQVGVSRELLEKFGAVSSQVVQAMAEGGLAQMQDSDESSSVGICVATTGVAGPSGGTAETPVGLCWIGVAITGRPTQVSLFRAPSGLSRVEYKGAFTRRALSLVGSFGKA